MPPAPSPLPSKGEDGISAGDARGFFSRHRKVGWAAAGVFCLLAFGAFFLYRWEGPLATLLAKVVPYPAAMVEGRVIRYADFREDLDLLKGFYQREQAAGTSVGAPSEKELRSRALERLIADRLAERAAARYGLVVTSDELRAAYRDVILARSADSSGGSAQAEKNAQEALTAYGFRPSGFKARILYPFLIRQKLERAMQDDQELNAEKIRKAEEALQALREGKAFKDVAAAYGEDPATAAAGGERGSFGRGALPAEIERAVFEAKIGEPVGVIRSELGYHVLRVTARSGEGASERVTLQEILIRPVRLDDYLAARRKTAWVMRFVR